MYDVFLHGYERMVRVGIYDHERTRPQPVRFDMDVRVAITLTAPETMANVYNYEQLARAIDACTSDTHVELLETMAVRIADILFHDPAVHAMTLRIAKLDVLPAASLGICYHRTRPVDEDHLRP